MMTSPLSSTYVRVAILALALGTTTACDKVSGLLGSKASASSAAPPTSAAALPGSYTIQSASNPGGGNPYKGEVTVAQQGDVYSVKWAIPNTPPYEGVALAEGKLLGVGWGLGKAYGVVVYQVKGGTLTGRWATSTSGPKAGIENLKGPEGLSGTYTITEGKNAAGKAYTGKVDIAKTGAVYKVSWRLPHEAYSGVGILKGDVLIVGWGTAGAGAGVVAYEMGETLNGTWSSPGATALGTEVLAKN